MASLKWSLNGYTITSWLEPYRTEHVVGMGVDGNMHELYIFESNGKWTYRDIGRATGITFQSDAYFTSSVAPNGEAHVIVMHLGAIHEFLLRPNIGQWEHRNISRDSGERPLSSGISITSWIAPNSDAHVVTVSGDDVVHEFYYIPNIGRRQHRNISQDTGMQIQNFLWWSLWVGLLPVFIFSIPFVIVRFEIRKKLKEIKRKNRLS